MLYTNHRTYKMALDDLLVKGPEFVAIGTFGLSIVTEWAQFFVEDLGEVPTVQIIVGVNGRDSRTTLEGIELIQSMFENIELRFRYDWHAKYIYAKGEHGAYLGSIIGGRNFVDSSWHDLSVDLSINDLLKVAQFHKAHWDSAFTEYHNRPIEHVPQELRGLNTGEKR